MIPIVNTQQEHLEKLLSTQRPGEADILAWYEHRLGFISRFPRLMLMPIDDHLAHRGDGIFETIKYFKGRMYGLDEHLERMQRSAEGIYLCPPCSWDELRDICIDVACAGGEENGMLRVLCGRGPGGFGISPFECPESSLYVIAYRFRQPSDEWYAKGLRGFRTSIPPKQGYLARIKNANYLPNVLMTREAKEKNADIPFCYTEDGFLTESAIANICLLDAQGTLLVPSLTNSLKGTTLMRAIEVLQGEVPHSIRTVTEEDVVNAREVFILGSGPECAAVVSYEGKPINDGKPGPLSIKLRKLLAENMYATGTPLPCFPQDA